MPVQNFIYMKMSPPMVWQMRGLFRSEEYERCRMAVETDSEFLTVSRSFVRKTFFFRMTFPQDGLTTLDVLSGWIHVRRFVRKKFCQNLKWPALDALSRDVRGGAFSSGAGRGQKSAGRGEGENPRGGAKERVNRLIQKFDKSAYFVMEIFIVYYDVLINENIISSHF